MTVLSGGKNGTNLEQGSQLYASFEFAFAAKSNKINALILCACSSDGLERRSPEPKVARSNRARRTTTNPITYSQKNILKNTQKRPSI
jgi:hypothetical protein